DECSCAHLKPIGRKTLDAEHKIGAVFAIEIALTNASLKIEVGRNGSAVEKLQFSVFEFIVERASALRLPPEAMNITAVPTLDVPGIGLFVIVETHLQLLKKDGVRSHAAILIEQLLARA